MSQVLEPRAYRRSLIRMTLAVFAIFTIHSTALKILWVETKTDITFMIPVLVDVIPYAMDLCEMIGMLVAYTAVLYNWRLTSRAQRRGYVISFIALTAYKFILQMIVSLIMDGAIPTGSDLLQGVLQMVLDIAQFAVVLIIIRSVMRRTNEFIAEKKSLEGKLEGYHFDEEALFFPFRSLIDRQNPLQRSALWIGVMITVTRAAQQLESDLFFAVKYGLDIPDSIVDLIGLVLGYVLTAVVGFAFYLGMLWGLMTLRGHELKFRSFNKN